MDRSFLCNLHPFPKRGYDVRVSQTVYKKNNLRAIDDRHFNHSEFLISSTQGNNMMYNFPLGLLLIIGPYCIQSQDMINQKMDVVDEDQSFSLRGILMQRSEEKDKFTAGSTRCKTDCRAEPFGHYICGTDYGWGYCCTGECLQYQDTMRCKSGIHFVSCGYAGNHTAYGTACLPSHHCGIHEEYYIFKPDYYWCYTDTWKNWDGCCRPYSKCTYRNWFYGYRCNVAYSSTSYQLAKCRA
ncbi:hypothetical protein CHS0354_024965 [Potamilus streckersoni]|uniref:Uncharacterized protein n=1 Tax=Potamilus streckersoni TaxID=2493646 RepID=A0AAE0T354_9BIVA|nr:hypothetical protein CHS0354_024965 [Potamilus streckersoni]